MYEMVWERYLEAPEGEYEAVITVCTVQRSEGGPLLSIEATITEGEYRGSRAWRNSSFSERAADKPGGVAQLLQSIDLSSLDFATASAEVPAAIAATAKGQALRIGVVHVETDDGRRVRVARFAPPP